MIEKSKAIKSAMKYVNSLLLPLEEYYYHHYNHALDVMYRAVYLWEKEWVSKEDIEVLMLAAIFHDTWFVIQYDDNEEFWAKIAENYLKTILYPKDKIEKVERLILATSPYYTEPSDLLESIIKDADLDNIWREDFFEKWDELKKEAETIKNIKIKDPDWHHSSLDLIYNSSFYTKTQKEERDKQKERNRALLEKIIKEKKENWDLKIYDISL